jgi:hypothetical protein
VKSTFGVGDRSKSSQHETRRTADGGYAINQSEDVFRHEFAKVRRVTGDREVVNQPFFDLFVTYLWQNRARNVEPASLHFRRQFAEPIRKDRRHIDYSLNGWIFDSTQVTRILRS